MDYACSRTSTILLTLGILISLPSKAREQVTDASYSPTRDQAELVVTWDDEFGYPDRIDFNGGFEEIITGVYYDVTIVFRNSGDEVLNIQRIQSDNRSFRIDQEEFSLRPDETREWELTFRAREAGEYEGILSFGTNDPDNEEVEIPLIAVSQDIELRHFTDFEETDRVHTLTIIRFTFRDDWVPAGWEIGIFTPDEALAGAIVWHEIEDYPISVYGDDRETEEVEGFTNGERFSFRVWDDENDEEYLAWAEFEGGDVVWTNDGESEISLNACVPTEQTIHYDANWNLLSWNIIPVLDDQWDPHGVRFEDNQDLREAFLDKFRDEEGHLRLISFKNSNGRFSSPTWGYCGLNYLSITEAILYHVTEPFDNVWEDFWVSPQTEIELEDGWNWIAYLP